MLKNDIFLFFQDFIFLCVQACAVAATQTVFAVTDRSDRRIVTNVATTSSGSSIFLCDPEMKKGREKEQLT